MRWKSVLVSLLIAAAVVAWMAGGNIGNEAVRTAAAEKEARPSENQTEEQPFLVTVRPAEAQQFARQIEISGRTKALRRSAVKAELQSRVIEIPPAEGDRVAEGDILALLSKDTRPAAYDSALAGLERAEKNYSAIKDLSAGGYQSDLELLQAKETLVRARQAVSNAEKKLDDTTIRAPYAGVIEKIAVEQGEMTAPGTVIAELIDLDPITVVAFASERELNHIRLGQQAEVTLINGEQYTGNVQYISASSDIRTGTFEIRIHLENPGQRLREGISSNVTIFGAPLLSHFTSKSLLTLDDTGAVGIKAVDNENRAVFYPVEIIEDTDEGVYLGGLPTNMQFIVVGQDFVKAGSLVRTELETS